MNLFNEDFNLIKKNDITFQNCCSGFNYSIVNDNVFIQWSNPGGNNSAFLNKNLEIINMFSFNILDNKHFKLDNEKNLIKVSNYGNGIYQEPSFSWRRGLLSKYSFSSTLSVEEEKSFNNNDLLNIFPNPTKNLFTINLKNNTFKKVNIYAINGQLLHTSFSNRINLKNYSNGLYLLKIYTLENTIINSKIIKN